MWVRSQQCDTLDALVFRYLGSGCGYLEQTLAINPALAPLGAVLPMGTLVMLPVPRATTGSARESIRLWE